MSDDQIRIAIAEICGWKIVESKLFKSLRSPSDGSCICCGKHLSDGEVWEVGLCGGEDYRCVFPDYPNDLNAMHEAERLLGEKQVRSYAFTLAQVLDTTPTVDLDDQFLNIHSTARQRCEAFLRLHCRWIEEKQEANHDAK